MAAVSTAEAELPGRFDSCGGEDDQACSRSLFAWADPLASLRHSDLTDHKFLGSAKRRDQAMKRLGRTIAAVIIATLFIPSGPSGAVTANGPYYPNPAWDQQLACASSGNCPRFIVLSNWVDTAHPSGGAAVLDRETGLVWEQSPDLSATALRPWALAHVVCNQKIVGNRLGWRLPTIQELASLVDLVGGQTDHLPPGHPFSITGAPLFWSATTAATDPANAWELPLSNGIPGTAGKISTLNVWCVRGGQGVDPTGG
jgi:hypothetical protein